jgi:anti-sigma-K factor RskA
MTDAGHNRWSEDVAAYMLGALDSQEAAEFEDHLEGCERCRSEMRWLTAAVEALPEAVERREPSPRLRDRVMTEVRAEARAAETGAPRRRLLAWFPGRGSGLGLRPVVGLAALALVVAAVVGYTLGGGGSGGGGIRTTTFVAGKPPGITARLVRAGNSGSLHLANVRQLPPNKVLEAWIERKGALIPVRALFAPDSSGRASTMVRNMGGAEAVLVTAEPRGGSNQPTSEPIVSIPVE